MGEKFVNFDLKERLPQESTREYVCRLLRTNILDLRLKPGSALSEKDIADRLQVSRTPVREAFIRLAQENYLDVVPQKGTYVSLIDPEQVNEARFCRESLEKAVIVLACTSFPKEGLLQMQSLITLQALCIEEKNYVRFLELDEEMHGTIFSGCKKARIWTVIQQMNTHYNRVRMLNLLFGYDWQLLLEQHREVFAAIRGNNPQAGAAVMALHLERVAFDVTKLQNQFGHFFKQPPKIYSTEQ